jgi:6-phosphofructokinase 1
MVGDLMRFHPVASLGQATIESPMLDKHGEEIFVDDSRRLMAFHEPEALGTERAVVFMLAGPRRRIFHDPATTTAAILTCGGLCPGLNNVIRSAVLELIHNYDVPRVLGIRYGYEGLNPDAGHEMIELTPAKVDSIHRQGGTILGSSRGPQDVKVMASTLRRTGINVLLVIGGDGTQRGAAALGAACRELGVQVSIVGIPKTIDNDVAYCDRSFGFSTAVHEASEAILAAHEEARGAYNGVGLVKLMGRDAGFIVAGATLASQEVNFALVPENPFSLEGDGGLLDLLEKRLASRQHAVIAVAEGAGQELFQGTDQTDASGNRRYGDVGLLLRERIEAHFRSGRIALTLKYIDPSYIIRSVPASTEDAVLCDQYGRLAVHAAMAGTTDAVVCFCRGMFALVPSTLVTSSKRHMTLDSVLWRGVLASTGQPASMSGQRPAGNRA